MQFDENVTEWPQSFTDAGNFKLGARVGAINFRARLKSIRYLAESAGAVEYNNCISEER